MFKRNCFKEIRKDKIYQVRESGLKLLKRRIKGLFWRID